MNDNSQNNNVLGNVNLNNNDTSNTVPPENVVLTSPVIPSSPIDNTGSNANQEQVLSQNLNANAMPVNPVEPPISEVPETLAQPINNGIPVQGAGTSAVEQNAQVQAENVSQPVPQAYTNPSTINAMPGFENSSTIGTTPPISLDEEKKPKKKTNKVAFIILILVLLAGVGFGTYYVLNYTDLLSKSASISIEVNNLELNVGDTLSNNINDFATITGTSSNNCDLDVTDVDTTKEGVYTYKVTCDTVEKTGQITIIDNTELVVETKKVYKMKGDTLVASEFAKTTDKTLTYEFVNEEEVNNILNGDYGTYTVNIKVTSANNKTAEVEGILVLIQHSIKGYLICSSNEQNVQDINATMTVSEKFAIVDDGNNGYGNIAYEIYKFKFSDETEYTNYLESFQQGTQIKINNITGDTTFDNDTHTITIENEVDNNTVVSEYGASNVENFRTLRSYFEKTLHYTCSYENRNA